MTTTSNLERAIALGQLIADCRGRLAAAEAELRALLGGDAQDPEPPQAAAAAPAPTRNQFKRRVFEQVLERGPVLVHLDARRDGAVVPAPHAADPKLVLRFGYNLTPPVVGMTWDDEGIAATLTFAGAAHLVVVPWESAYLVRDESGNGAGWPDDFPREVLAEGSAPERPRLRSVPDAPDQMTAEERARAATKREAPDLRLVRDDEGDEPGPGAA